MKSEKLDTMEELSNLRREFCTRLVQAERELDESWKEVLRSEWAEEAVQDLIQRVHHLAGAGGTFGCPSVSQRGKELETVLHSLEGTRPDLSHSSEIGEMVARLRKVCLSEARGSGSRRYQTEIIRSPMVSSRTGPVFIIESDPTVSRQLVLQVASFGYTIRTFPSLLGLGEASLLADPCAIVMDTTFLGGADEGEAVLRRLQSGRSEPIPILYLSEQSDLESRLRAVRAGGRAYFTRPVDYDHLVEVLQALTTRESQEPYRILIVEDDRQVATYCARVLEEAGMIPSAVTNPMSALSMLAAFRPDLILMDLYMPDCSGVELSTVIRQQRMYDGIPIVYLSGETDLDRQLAAMRMGGDEFLTKPILPEHLIGSVVVRAQRSRLLRSYMVKDGLTGLANHSIGMQQLDVAIMQSRARRTRLGYALIDLDHFHSVNDVYGHPAGDRVLRNLALLLKRRLRKSDMICRFGGEEFAVILPDTDGLDVVKILDEIRSDFAEVHHRSNGDEFATTFSAGVATSPPHGDVLALTEAARSALYEAKQNGRNRLVLV